MKSHGNIGFQIIKHEGDKEEMRRKVLVGLVMALVLSLSACGGSEGTASDTGKESSVQSGEATDNTDTKGEGSGVKAVKITDTVYVLAEAFTDNEELQYVILGSGLKEIDMCAFQNCTSLIRVELPEGVEKLGINAFAGAMNLEYIYIPNSVVEMETTAIVADESKCVIAGKSGSKAEEFANQWNYTFEAVD